jgi:hypothetical protein
MNVQPKREDGLKNPARYLKSWGYHYIYMPQIDLNKLAERIYQGPNYKKIVDVLIPSSFY